MSNPKTRSRLRLLPRFPRIRLLLLRRKIDRSLDWYCSADNEGNVSIHPKAPA